MALSFNDSDLGFELTGLVIVTTRHKWFTDETQRLENVRVRMKSLLHPNLGPVEFFRL